MSLEVEGVDPAAARDTNPDPTRPGHGSSLTPATRPEADSAGTSPGSSVPGRDASGSRVLLRRRGIIDL